jgi:hypothetical protein
MAEDIIPEPVGERGVSPRATSILAFLQSKQAARSFLTSLESLEVALPDEQQRADVVEKALTDIKLSLKLSELIRLAAADETAGRIRKTLMITGSEFVRAHSKSLANWGLIATASPEVDLGMLARHFRNARETNDKALIANAELALQTGLAILSARLDFDIVGALKTLGQQLFDRPLDPYVADKIVKKALRRASTKSLEIFAAISQVQSITLEESRKKLAISVAELQSTRDELRASREARKALEAEVDKRGGEVEVLQTELNSLKGKIAGVRGGAADDLTRLRARVRQFCDSKVLRVLSTADEALSLEPPSYRVARERVGDVLIDVRKELEWLDQS